MPIPAKKMKEVKNDIVRLCVPIIYEDNYIGNIIDYNDRYSNEGCIIYEVYGSLRTDIIGNLRPSFSIKDIYLSKLHANYSSFLSVSRFDENTKQDAFLERKIGIDNRKMDGFIDLFQNNECNGVCERCSICEIMAHNIIINKDWQKRVCQDLEKRMNSKLLL